MMRIVATQRFLISIHCHLAGIWRHELSGRRFTNEKENIEMGFSHTCTGTSGCHNRFLVNGRKLPDAIPDGFVTVTSVSAPSAVEVFPDKAVVMDEEIIHDETIIFD